MLHIFHQSLVLTVPVFQIGSSGYFFPQFYASFIHSFLLLPLLLLVNVSATLLLCFLCQSMPRFFFPHLLPFFFAFYRAKAENVFSTSFACFSKEIFLWSKGCSLGTTALCFLFIFIRLTSKLFLTLSFPRISFKHLSSASHWLPSTSLSFHQAPVGLLRLFSLPAPCSCIPAYLHSLCGRKGGSGRIGSFTCSLLTCWRRYLSLPQSEVGPSPAVFLPLHLGIYSLLPFLSIRTVLCCSNKE